MDTSLKAGDDFDKYANGAWEKSAQIPADKSNVSVFSVDQRPSGAAHRRPHQGHGAVEPDERRRGEESPIITKLTPTPNAIEQRGLAPIKADVDKIEAIADKGALAEAIGRTLRADTDPLNNTNFATENLFGIFVTQDFNDRGKSVPYVMQGGLGLPDRDYYVSS